MKSTVIVALFLVFAVVLATRGKKVPPHYQQSWTAVTDPYKEECIKETGVDRTYADRVFSHSEYPNDEALKCYIKCVCLGMRILNGSSGKWKENDILRKVSGVTPEIYKNCNDETEAESNLCQKSFDMSKCFVRDVSVNHE